MPLLGRPTISVAGGHSRPGAADDAPGPPCLARSPADPGSWWTGFSPTQTPQSRQSSSVTSTPPPTDYDGAFVGASDYRLLRLNSPNLA